MTLYLSQTFDPESCSRIHHTCTASIVFILTDLVIIAFNMQHYTGSYSDIDYYHYHYDQLVRRVHIFYFNSFLIKDSALTPNGGLLNGVGALSLENITTNCGCAI